MYWWDSMPNFFMREIRDVQREGSPIDFSWGILRAFGYDTAGISARFGMFGSYAQVALAKLGPPVYSRSAPSLRMRRMPLA
jgi:hypothetical protein